jgi:hypothetical protein
VLTATMTALPLAVRQELMAGTFERFAVSPTGAAAGVAAMLIFPMVSALATSTIQIVVAAIVFPLDLHWSTAPLAVPVALLGALSFAPFALLMAAAVVTLKQVTGAVPFVTTAMAFVGGFFFPVALLPDWIEWMSEVQPFTPVLDLQRHLLVNTPLHDPAWESVLKIAAFAIVLLPLSGLVLRHADRVLSAVATERRELLRSAVEVPDRIIYRDFPSETIALNAETGQYFGLNSTAARMLTALDEAGTVAGALALLAEWFARPAGELEPDLIELCEALAERGLIVLTPANGG